MSAKLPYGTLDKLWEDSNNWRGCIIYVCKDDPRIIVPKKPKRGGWTFNFAHAAGWLVLLSCLLSSVLPTIYFFQAKLIWAGLGYEAGIIGFWCVLSVILSSPKRFENRS